MSVQTATKLIVKRLHELLNVPVVPTDNAGNKPAYPYLSYKVTTPRSKPNGSITETELVASSDENFEFDIQETIIEQPTFTVSISAYDETFFSAMELAEEALKAVKTGLYYELKGVNAVVEDTSGVTDRTILIVDHYEHRYGFDVMIRYTDETTLITETIEEFTFNQGGINE